MTDEGYYNLVEAIVFRAIQDYVIALKKNNPSRILEVENFFEKELPHYSDIDGAGLLDSVKRKINAGIMPKEQMGLCSRTMVGGR